VGGGGGGGTAVEGCAVGATVAGFVGTGVADSILTGAVAASVGVFVAIPVGEPEAAVVAVGEVTAVARAIGRAVPRGESAPQLVARAVQATRTIARAVVRTAMSLFRPKYRRRIGYVGGASNGWHRTYTPHDRHYVRAAGLLSGSPRSPHLLAV